VVKFLTADPRIAASDWRYKEVLGCCIPNAAVVAAGRGNMRVLRWLLSHDDLQPGSKPSAEQRRLTSGPRMKLPPVTLVLMSLAVGPAILGPSFRGQTAPSVAAHLIRDFMVPLCTRADVQFALSRSLSLNAWPRLVPRVADQVTRLKRVVAKSMATHKSWGRRRQLLLLRLLVQQRRAVALPLIARLAHGGMTSPDPMFQNIRRIYQLTPSKPRTRSQVRARRNAAGGYRASTASAGAGAASSARPRTSRASSSRSRGSGSGSGAGGGGDDGAGRPSRRKRPRRS